MNNDYKSKFVFTHQPELTGQLNGETESSLAELLRVLTSLIQSENQYKQLAEMLPEVVFEIDIDGRVIFFNKNAFDLTGYTQADIDNGLDVSRLVIPADRPRLKANMHRIMAGKELGGNEYVGLTKGGDEIAIVVKSSRIMRDGKSAGLRGFALNITDKAKTLSELKNKSDSIRLLLDTVSSLIVRLDSHSKIKEFNRTCERVTGYAQNEVLGHNWLDIFIPEGYDHSPFSDFARWIKDNPDKAFESPVIAKSGGTRSVLWSGSLIALEQADSSDFIFIGQDITDFKNAEAALNQSEERYHQLLEQSNEAVYLLVNDKFEFVNSRFHELLGWTQEELRSPDFHYMRLVAPSSKKIIEDRLKILDQGGLPPSRYEYTALTKDGREIELEASIAYVNYNGKKVIQGVYRDITERKNVRKTMVDAQFNLNQIFNAAMPMNVIDKDYTIIQINNTYSELYKVKAEDVVGRKCYEIYPGPNCHNSQCAIKQILSGKNSYEYDDVTKLDDGTEVHSLVAAYPFRNNEGEIIGIVESFKDITQRKKAEDALRKSQEYYRAVWENSPVGICLSDKEGIYHYVNPAYCKIYGFSEKELIGKNFYDLIVPPEKANKKDSHYRKTFEHDISSPVGETEFIRKDGKRIWVQYTSDFIRHDGKPIFKVSMNIDITEKKMAEKALEESREKFEIQFKRLPIPSLFWQKLDDDFILIDYNNAAVAISNGTISNYIGAKASEFEKDNPGSFKDFWNSFNNKSTVNRELTYQSKSSGEKMYLSVSYVFIPPDHVIVHTEDISLRRTTEIQNKARLGFLNDLRTASTIDECLTLGCLSIYEAELFKRSVFTLHNEKREIINLGYYGLEEDVIKTAREAPAPNHELTRALMQEKYRISNSYFIPQEAGLPITESPRYIEQTCDSRHCENTWQPKDELFVPILSDNNIIKGWLSVDSPFNCCRPSMDTIMFLEEIAGIVIKKIHNIIGLEELNKGHQDLKEANITLRQVLAAIDEEKIQFKNLINDKINLVIMPILNRLVSVDGKVKQSYLNALKNDLRELTSVSDNKLSILTRLSSREAEICQLITGGATSKEIADLLNLSLGTVQKHREKIRKKLGITNKSINLETFLKKLMRS